MPFRRPLSVFVSYSHLDDEARARLDAHLTSLRLEGAISQWHDRRITAGAEWQGAIDEQLKSADIILLLISPNFLNSTYCVDIEATEAIRRHLAGEARVVPIILSHVDWRLVPIGAPDDFPEHAGRSRTSLGILKALPRDGKPVADLKEWGSQDAALLNVTEGLRQVVNELAPERPPAAPPRPPAPPDLVDHGRARVPAASDDRTDIAIGRLSKLLRLDNVTYFIGSRFFLPPGPAEIARHLLGEDGLQMIESSWNGLLPCLDSIGSYYAIANGAALLEDEVSRFISEQSRDVPAVHALLAQLLTKQQRQAAESARAQLRAPERKPQLIVSTNVDLMMERALFAAGLSFTRIVQHLSEPKLTVTEVRDLSVIPPEYHPLGRRTVRVAQPDPAGGPPRECECDPGDVAQIDDALALFDRTEIALRPAGSPEGIGNQNPLESLPVKRFRSPILYKLRGSQDVRLSCGLSTEQYLEFCLRMAHRFVPTQIREIVAQTPLVFLGYGFLDPEFRLVYHTFEEALVGRQSNVYPIYAVQLPPHREPSDNYRAMELGLWEQLKEVGPRKAPIATLEESPEGFLRRMLGPLQEERGVA